MGVEAVAFAFEHGDQDGVGVGRMHDHVHDAGFGILFEDMFPGHAAVGGLEDAAFRVVAVAAAEGADVDDVGIGGMDEDFADLVGLVQAHVFPGFAAVGGLVDAVAT